MKNIQELKKLNPKGYVLIRLDDGWKLEHKLVMEEYLGRELTIYERVHHDDFNKLNNHISNLTLFPSNKQHSHFHRQIKQFGMTKPRLIEIRRLKELMEVERRNNEL